MITLMLSAWLLTTPVNVEPTVESAAASGPVVRYAEGTALTGVATWYDDGPGLYAAVSSWRWGDTPYRIRVCTDADCVTVIVRDFCACPGGRVVDLSPTAFQKLAPLSRGIVRVTVTDLRDATLPATDR